MASLKASVNLDKKVLTQKVLELKILKKKKILKTKKILTPIIKKILILKMKKKKILTLKMRKKNLRVKSKSDLCISKCFLSFINIKIIHLFKELNFIYNYLFSNVFDDRWVIFVELHSMPEVRIQNWG
jgi:hypothetical protein